MARTECAQTDVLRATSGKRIGFAVVLHLICRECGHDFGGTYSSPEVSTEKKKPSPFAVNDMTVIMFDRLRLGHTAMCEFSAIFGILPMYLKTFQKKEVRIIKETVEATDTMLKQSAAIVREMHLGLNPDFPADDPVPITVSFDGSWHKRGHTSMYGVAAVIEVMTGLVVDYVTLSSYCLSYSLKRTSLCDDVAAFDEWYVGYRNDCCINYHGSSNAMEVEAAKRLWSRSVHQRGLMYTGLLRDGDSKAYNAVVALQPYGPDVTISKEECLNHAHKRMGTSLLKLAKSAKLGGRGQGRLTKEKALRMQHYFCYALNAGVGDVDDMRQHVWASVFHCMSTDSNPKHTRWAMGDQSWCFYQRAVAIDEEPPAHADNIRHPLAPDVAKATMPVYTRMSESL